MDKMGTGYTRYFTMDKIFHDGQDIYMMDKMGTRWTRWEHDRQDIYMMDKMGTR
ncbi:MAG: hypothetical protein LCH52_02650 [Bacteroidetes bacterium]|nr:hypothetical protein [Bacteroidota bacterium]